MFRAPSRQPGPLRGKGRFLGIAAVAAALLVGAPWRAMAGEPTDDDVRAASEAYDRAKAAYDKGAYAEAAADFARADALVPNAVTLELALRAAVQAGDGALAMTLVERSERAERSPKLAAAVRAARAKFEKRTGRYVIKCPEGAQCTADVDGAAAPVGSPSWAMVGEHAVEITVDGQDERQTFSVKAGETTEVIPNAKPKPKKAAGAGGGAAPVVPVAQSRKPLSPVFVWVGAGVTGALAIGTTASGLDTLAKHGEFEKAPSAERKSSGQGAQLRTNVLLGLTAVGAVATGAMAVLLVDWSGESDGAATKTGLRASAMLLPHAGFAAVSTRF